MDARFALADVAWLIGEPARAAILLALLDGGSLNAGRLAREANLSAAAASLHLSKLTGGGLLTVRRHGRQRYFQLASKEVAGALEALGAISTAPPQLVSPERAARSCYDHLAGMLAVDLLETLEAKKLVRKKARAYQITRRGGLWFAEVLDIDVEVLDNGRRALARSCLDWTERRPHLAGALGAAVLSRFLEKRWVAKRTGTRALRITTAGSAALSRLGITIA